MTTVVKAKRAAPATVPMTATKAPLQPAVVYEDENLTVEQFLEKKFESLVKELRDHADTLVGQLQKQCADGTAAIQGMISILEEASVCVTLKVTAGPHIGQKFRLETLPGKTEDIFKMGRSTGKEFKEKGISLHRDKEISTFHGKIEIRNGQAFFVDTKSTNGSQFNGEDCIESKPYLLKNGDVITMGSSDMMVSIYVNGEIANNENAGV